MRSWPGGADAASRGLDLVAAGPATAGGEEPAPQRALDPDGVVGREATRRVRWARLLQQATSMTSTCARVASRSGWPVDDHAGR